MALISSFIASSLTALSGGAWTVYLLYALLLGAALLVLFYLTIRRFKRQRRKWERIVDERTRELQEKNRALEKEKKRVEEAHADIDRSISFAETIQQAVLHAEEPVTPGLPEHFILFQPHSKVSGDFHWGKVHHGHLYAAAVDCTGHGVPGAMMSMLGISFLNDIMTTGEFLEPGEVLARLKARVVNEMTGVTSKSGTKSGMDAALLRIPLNENAEKEVKFAGAQLPAYVIRKGIGEEDPEGLSPDHPERIRPFKNGSDGISIKGDPQPIGYYEYGVNRFRTTSLRLQAGDMLYIFSDGYADQFGGPRGKKFRYGPFKRLLVDIREKPAEKQKEELRRNLEKWKEEGEQDQIDDVLVIGIRL